MSDIKLLTEKLIEFRNERDVEKELLGKKCNLYHSQRFLPIFKGSVRDVVGK